MKYLIGQVLHLLLEETLRGSSKISIDKIIDKTGCKYPTAKRLLQIIENYKKTNQFRKFIRFFSKYDFTSDWKMLIEYQLHETAKPDIILINRRKRKVVIIDIKTGDRSKSKLSKILIQLLKYYKIAKYTFKGYCIKIFVFWVKFGEFESYSQLIREMNENLIKVGGRYVEANEPTRSNIIYCI